MTPLIASAGGRELHSLQGKRGTDAWVGTGWKNEASVREE